MELERLGYLPHSSLMHDQNLYAPIFVTVLNHVERVHLRNRLLGELKGDVA